MLAAARRLSIKLVLATALAALALGAQAASAATLKADYRFNGTRASSVGTAPDLTDIGAGTNAFATETVDGSSRKVLTYPLGNGVQASTSGVIAQDDYSIAFLFRIETIIGFRKLVDFKNATSDCGLYNLSGDLTFFCGTSGSGGPITASSGGDPYHQVVLTRDGASDLVVGYLNGAQQFSFTDSSDHGVASSDILRFFKDDTVQNAEHSAGAVARIRLWDGDLTSTEVAALDRNPPLNKCDSPDAITGTGGDDTINGSANKDIICTFGGDDTVNGMGGDDVIYGGEGNDELTGGDNAAGDPGTNKDTIFGEGGNDRTFGGLGNDILDGGAGGDVGLGVGLFGGDGHDLIYGRGGSDNARGNAGNDTIYGNDSADVLQGDEDNDRLFGGAGSDTSLNGGSGHDAIFGEAGADNMFGLAGNDSFVPGPDTSADDMAGGDDIDRASYANETGSVYASIDGSANDGTDPDGPGGAGDGTAEGDHVRLDIENVSTGSGADTLIGSDGANTLDAGDGADDITGDPPGPGAPDVLIGRAGNDILRSRDDGARDRDYCGDGAGDQAIQDPFGFDLIYDCETFDVS